MYVHKISSTHMISLANPSSRSHQNQSSSLNVPLQNQSLSHEASLELTPCAHAARSLHSGVHSGMHSGVPQPQVHSDTRAQGQTLRHDRPQSSSVPHSVAQAQALNARPELDVFPSSSSSSSSSSSALNLHEHTALQPDPSLEPPAKRRYVCVRL
jgi:hypothetical protein